MAVTQQMARISSRRASAASCTETEVDALLSRRVEGNDAFADFDWSPAILQWSLEALDREELATAVSCAFEGREILNRQFRAGTTDNAVFSEIRIVRADAVVELDKHLRQLPVAAMTQSRAAIEVTRPGRELPQNFEDYVRRMAAMLMNFYTEAASRNQVIITWWD